MRDAERLPRRPSDRHKTGNPGLAFLVCVAWYGAVASAFLWYVDRQPVAASAACDDSMCFSDRGGWLMFGLFVGAPTLLVSGLVSLLVLGILAAKTEIKSATILGSLAALPALLPIAWLVAAVTQ
ncbi:hypothetical protein [Krasilnikovia sp. MM14-A1259]|uniref:hypothetical protein n=1 Tax=Krasilnikovia sp. MM14-A1259 TaxID=3373539 RepID=UPI003813D9DF